MAKLSALDLNNIDLYKKKQVRAFDKKRLIEKNKLGMNQEFAALKNRVSA
jgi:hypothetical protein